MNIPPVGQIEAAIDAAIAVPPTETAKELHELKMLGLARRKKLKDGLPKITEFERGYLLGLETARVALSGMPAAVAAGVMV